MNGGLFGGDERQHTEGTAGAVDYFEGGGDENCAGGRELVEIAEAGEAEFASAVHERVAGERRFEATGLTGICPDCFDPDAEDVTFVGEKLNTVFVPTGGMGAIDFDVEEVFAGGALRPVGAEEHP